METLNPALFMSPNPMAIFLQGSASSSGVEWTRDENKLFESALAIFDERTPNRWARVAAMIPGKTEYDVIKQYKELEDDVSDIEAGRVPVPGYFPQGPFEFEWFDERDCFRKKPPQSARAPDHERKKGVPWTREEHRRFLLGLMKYGKGDWRNISRNFVATKTPTQVASHAQKYFLRQISGGKDKRRPSIHDFTVVNLAEPASHPNDNSPPFFTRSPAIQPVQLHDEADNALRNWNISKSEAIMALFASSSYDMSLNGLKPHPGQALYGDAVRYGRASRY